MSKNICKNNSNKSIRGGGSNKIIYKKNGDCSIIDYMIVQEINNMELNNMYNECLVESQILKDKIKEIVCDARIDMRYIQYIKLYGVPLNWNFDQELLNNLIFYANPCG